jgi:hypothetical protein
MRSNTMLKGFALVVGLSRNQPDGSGSGNAGGGFQPLTVSYHQPDGSGSGNAGGGFLPPAL